MEYSCDILINDAKLLSPLMISDIIKLEGIILANWDMIDNLILRNNRLHNAMVKVKVDLICVNDGDIDALNSYRESINKLIHEINKVFIRYNFKY